MNSHIVQRALKNEHDPKSTVNQLVISSILVRKVLHYIHDAPLTGHPGKDRYLRQARPAYRWPTMRKDIPEHINTCQTCAENNAVPTIAAPILPYPILQQPWDTVAMNLLKESGLECLFVCTDYFSCFCILILLVNLPRQLPCIHR